MQSKGSEEQKRNLIEKIGRHFENGENSSPLAATKNSTRNLNRKYGSTSEEPVSELDADNGISGTHSNPFFTQTETQYATRCEDRKRYFTVSAGYITPKAEQFFLRWQKETGLHHEKFSYKFPINCIPPKHHRSFL